MLPFSVAIFTSAFLVFQVQPIIARFILPWYGGTPSVWTTCMLFFQLGLLAGYLYAHVLANHLQLKHQAIVHGCLLVVSLFLLPITPELAESTQGLPQTFQILKILAVSVGFPFILLSASAPLLQHWFANAYPDKSPYRLYALSNFGSLLALLSYPFLVEPALRLSTQTIIWSFAYFAFLGMTLWCAWSLTGQKINQILSRQSWKSLLDINNFINRLKQASVEEKTYTSKGNSATVEKAPEWFDRISWMLLAACGSVVLLAVTNQISQDVAVIPFLWVVPLSLYLISFIICFERDAWYQRKIWLPFLAFSIALLVYLLNRDYADSEWSLGYQLLIYCTAMFACCMVCHGEMVRRRPTAGYLTMFYVYVALGGALGGIFVNLAAPLLFDGFWELHGSLVLVCLLAILFIAFDHHTLNRFQRSIIVSIGFIGVGTLIWFLEIHISEQQDTSIFNKRNFFGILHVYEENKGEIQHSRSLFHGRIRHGEQFIDESKQHQPTSYYVPHSGVGLALNRFPSRTNNETRKRNSKRRRPKSYIPPRTEAVNKPMRVAAIGLGIGTIAAYGRPNDYFRFYEINQEVESVARKYFSYLENSKAEIDVVIGDGRGMLQHELETSGSQQYDVIIVDAFTGDAVPVHLLTKEASDLYWQHLKENGVLALHISNLHVDLSDVVRQMAKQAGKDAIFIEYDSRKDSQSSNDWVIITSNRLFINDRHVRRFRNDWDHKLKPIVWTDDFSNLFDIVQW